MLCGKEDATLEALQEDGVSALLFRVRGAIVARPLCAIAAARVPGAATPCVSPRHWSRRQGRSSQRWDRGPAPAAWRRRTTLAVGGVRCGAGRPAPCGKGLRRQRAARARRRGRCGLASCCWRWIRCGGVRLPASARVRCADAQGSVAARAPVGVPHGAIGSRGATALTGVRDAAAAAVIATATAAAAAARCLTWSGATIKILSPRRCTQRPTRASGPRGTARRRCTPTPTVFWQRCYQAACRRIQVQSEQQGHSACMRTSAFLQEKRGRVRSGTTTLTARASIRERAWTPAGTTAMRRAWL